MSDDNTDTGDMVPRSRLNEIVAERNDFQSKFQDLETRYTESVNAVAGWKAVAAESEGYKTKIAELEASMSKKEGTWNVDRTLLESGITDTTTREFLAFKHSQAEGTPEFGDWFSKNKDGFANLLPKAGEVKTEETKVDTKADTKVIPTGNEGTKPSPNPGSVFDPVAIAKMTPEEYALHGPSLL